MKPCLRLAVAIIVVSVMLPANVALAQIDARRFDPTGATTTDRAVLVIPGLQTTHSIVGLDGQTLPDVTKVLGINEGVNGGRADRRTVLPTELLRLSIRTEIGPASVFLRENLIGSNVVSSFRIYVFLANGYEYHINVRNAFVTHAGTIDLDGQFVDEFEFSYEDLEWSVQIGKDGSEQTITRSSQ